MSIQKLIDEFEDLNADVKRARKDLAETRDALFAANTQIDRLARAFKFYDKRAIGMLRSIHGPWTSHDLPPPLEEAREEIERLLREVGFDLNNLGGC